MGFCDDPQGGSFCRHTIYSSRILLIALILCCSTVNSPQPPGTGAVTVRRDPLRSTRGQSCGWTDRVSPVICSPRTTKSPLARRNIGNCQQASMAKPVYLHLLTCNTPYFWSLSSKKCHYEIWQMIFFPSTHYVALVFVDPWFICIAKSLRSIDPNARRSTVINMRMHHPTD